MEINYIAVLVATAVQFIIGAVWYSALFGKVWGEIHGFDKLSPEAQKEMMSKMTPFYVLQFVLTIVTTVVFAIFVATGPQEWHAFGLAGFYWLGFVMPAQVAAVIWGGTEGKWIVKKILISVGASLACYMAMAAVFYFI